MLDGQLRLGGAAQRDRGTAAAGHLFQEARDPRPVHLCEPCRGRPNEVDGHRSGEQAESRGDTGSERHDDLRDADLASDGHGVDGPRSSKREHRVLAGIAVSLCDVAPHRGRHALVDDVVHAPGRAQRVEAELLRQAIDGRARGRLVQRHGAPEEGGRLEVAEERVRIGHRRKRAPSAVAGRAGLGARARGADLEQAELVHAGDAATPGADLQQVDHRNPQRNAASRLEPLGPRRLEIGAHPGLVVVDQADLGGGAPHVEADDVVALQPARERGRGEGTGRRAGLDHHDRLPPCDVDREGSSVRAHEEQTPVLEPAVEPAEVAVEQRLDIRVGNGRRETLVFAELPRELRRERDRELRETRRVRSLPHVPRARDWRAR